MGSDGAVFGGGLGEGSLLTSTKTTIKPSTWKPAIFHTARILDVIDPLYEDNSNSLGSDVSTHNTVFNVGLKLSMLLNCYRHEDDRKTARVSGDRMATSSASHGVHDSNGDDTVVAPLIDWSDVDSNRSVPLIL